MPYKYGYATGHGTPVYRRVLSLEAMRRFLDDQGIEAGDLGPEALKAYIASEHARYGRMVRETGVRVE